MKIPGPPSLFVGRDSELQRLRRGLTQTRVALIVGVGGVGKTTLAAALAGGWPQRSVFHRVAEHEGPAEVVDAVRRELAQGPVPETLRDEDRLEDLSARLDAADALLVIDDLHRLGKVGHDLFFARLPSLLRKASILATSRAAEVAGADAPYRLELQLEGLGEGEARSLWAALDELYGAKGGFDVAIKRSHGNPFLLRRAHAGELHDEDPVLAAVRALSADERRLAAALALASMPLPSRTLLTLLPRETGAEALRRLVIRMVVSVDGAGTCTLHDLFRSALTSEMTPEEKGDIHQALIAAVDGWREVDDPTRVREVCRHLVAVGRFPDAGEFLITHGPTLVRQGASSELLAALDTLPPAARAPDVKVLRAHTLGRRFQVRQAYEELRELNASGERGWASRLAFAHMALLSAKLDDALKVLDEIIADDDAPPAVRTRALTSWVVIHSLRGSEDARTLLDSAAEGATDPTDKASLLFCKAFILFLEGRNAEAEGPVRQAVRLFQEAPRTYRGSVLFPAFAMTVMGTLGQFEESDTFRVKADAAIQGGEDPRMRVYLQACKANTAYERGQQEYALAQMAQVVAICEPGGEVLWTQWFQIWIGHYLVGTGRLRDGLALLARMEQAMKEGGIVMGVRRIENLRATEPLLRLLKGDWEFPEPNQPARRHALAALEAACGGGSVRPERPRGVGTEGIGLDAALERLVEAIDERQRGNGDQARRLLEQATRLSDESGADAGLMASLLEALAPVSLVTPSGRRAAQKGPSSSSLEGTLLDGQRHLLKTQKGEPLSLVQRPVLRRLLYALAGSVGQALSNEDLVRRAWGYTYDPRFHDNMIRVNVRRLRVLLDSTPLRVEHEEAGYRLQVPQDFVYVEASPQQP